MAAASVPKLQLHQGSTDPRLSEEHFTNWPLLTNWLATVIFFDWKGETSAACNFILVYEWVGFVGDDGRLAGCHHWLQGSKDHWQAKEPT